MALGTPVAAAAAYSAASGTTVAPAYPSGILSTDEVVLFVGMKPAATTGGTVTTPSGWTLRDSLTQAGGYAAQGADTGNTSLWAFSWDSPVAGQTGSLSVTIGENNVAWAFMVRIPTGGNAVTYGTADGQRTTTPTSPMTVALTNGTTATNFQAGDLALWAMVVPTDVTTPAQFSAHSVTASGATFGTAVEINEPDSTTGNDIGGFSAHASVSSGSSTAAPSITVTLAGTLTNVRGPVVMLRVREAAPAPITGDLDATESGSDTFAADGGPVIQGSLSVSETGADTFSGSGTVTDATITGDLSAAETGADSFSASGAVTDPAITGTLSATETGTDTLAASGDVIVQGSLSVTETGADTLAASGGVLVQGSLSVTETGTDAFSASGGVIVQGLLSVTEAGADTFSASGGVASTGSLSATEAGADTLSAAGAVLVQGSLSATETGTDTLSASGASFTSGSLSATENGEDTLSAEGLVIVQGDLSATEAGEDAFTAAGTSEVQGDLSATETDADSFSASGSVQSQEISGALDAQEVGADTASISGGVVVSGSLAAQEEGADQFQAAGADVIYGSANLLESLSDSFSGQGGVRITGTAALSELGTSATLDLSFTGGSYQALVLDTMQAAGVIPSVGSFAASETVLDTFAASGGRLSSGDLAATDQPDTAAGSGVVIVTGYAVAYETGADVLSLPAGYWEYFAEAGYAVADEVGRVLVNGSASILETVEDSASSTGQILIAGNAGIAETITDTMAAGIILGFAKGGTQARRQETKAERLTDTAPSRSGFTQNRPMQTSERRP